MIQEDRVSALRAAMAQGGLDAYIIPSSDPHQSEYTADHWKARAWFTGFTGSAGLLVVTRDHAGLWTDSRYFLQAEQQLAGGPVVLQRQEVPHRPEHILWLAENLDAGSVVGLDGSLFSFNQLRHLKRLLEPKGIKLKADLDLVSDIWEKRPPLPEAPVFELAESYAGASRSDKLAQLRQALQDIGEERTHYLVSTLDDIAWLLNLRGNDVEFNPVFLSYLLLGKRKALLFIDEDKVSPELKARLDTDGVHLKAYGEVERYLRRLPDRSKVLVDPKTINVRLIEALGDERVATGENLVAPLKAVKNEAEIAHLRKTMVKDGVALCKLYRWLDAMLESRTVSEFEVARQLEHFRRAGGEYHGESFAAIVGYGANGAIVHYRPDPETSAEIAPAGILLIDSGGQYTTGTTDITRTTALSEPEPDARRLFTLVLKGHIGLATAHFPKGTTGVQLDTLARAPLWSQGKNYGHGTGHGVGFFLNVHEGPQGFAPSTVTGRGTTALQAGMVTSNEPGYYETGAFGIRIENLMLCTDDPEHDGFLKFETLTLFPIDRALIDPDLLTRSEKAWLNTYHATVFEQLAPHLNPEETAWLQEKCQPF